MTPRLLQICQSQEAIRVVRVIEVKHINQTVIAKRIGGSSAALDLITRSGLMDGPSDKQTKSFRTSGRTLNKFLIF